MKTYGSEITFRIRSTQNCTGTVHRDSASGFKGVHWSIKRKRWIAFTKFNKKGIYLGSFMDKESAARAYDEFVVDTYGDFALTNQSLGLIST